MYLRGATLAVAVNGQIQNFSSITVELDQALHSGYPVGHSAEQFMGGWLIDGCPLNVFFGQGWQPGQKEALLAAGKTQCPGVMPQPAIAPAPIPTQGSSPTIVSGANQSPYSGDAYTAEGRRILPTGIQTPSAPIVIQTPSGQTLDYGLQSPPQAPAVAVSPDYGLWIAAAALLFSVFGRRK